MTESGSRDTDHPRGTGEAQGRARASAERQAARGRRRGSRRRASSATSPRTPSTTTPRTSRRCSSSGSPQLQDKLRRSTVIDEKHVDTEQVEVGAIVHVKDQKSGKSQKFQLVGSAEADPAEHKLSNESPIGKAADRQEEERGRDGRDAARPQEEAQDHQDRARSRDSAARLAREMSPSLRADRRAAGEARAPARGRASSRSRTPSRGGPRSPRCARPTRASSPGPRRRPATGSPDASLARRGHGKASFLDIRDGSGKLQIQARIDELGDELRGPARARPRRHRRGRGDRLRLQARRAHARADRLGAARQEPAPAAGEVPRPRGRRDALPQAASWT